MSDTTRIYLIEDDRTILQFVEESLRRRPQWKLVGHSDTFAHAQVMAPLSLADSVAGLRAAIASITPDDNGHLIHHDGRRAAHW